MNARHGPKMPDGERTVWVGHGGKRIDVHLDLQSGVPREVAIPGHHRDDRLTHEVHRSVGQKRALEVVHAGHDRRAGDAPHLAVQIVVAEDRHYPG